MKRKKKRKKKSKIAEASADAFRDRSDQSRFQSAIDTHLALRRGLVEDAPIKEHGMPELIAQSRAYVISAADLRQRVESHMTEFYHENAAIVVTSEADHRANMESAIVEMSKISPKPVPCHKMPFPNIYIGFDDAMPITSRDADIIAEYRQARDNYSTAGRNGIIAVLFLNYSTGTSPAELFWLGYSLPVIVLLHELPENKNLVVSMATLLPNEPLWEACTSLPLGHLINTAYEFCSERKTLLNLTPEVPSGDRAKPTPGLPPKPGYIVKPSPGTLSNKEASKRNENDPWPFGYKFDRRGHETCYIREGLEPLESQRLRWFTAHDYRVYRSGAQVPEDDRERLERRGYQVPSTGSWLAMKHTWRKSTIVGQNCDNLIYVEGTRIE